MSNIYYMLKLIFRRPIYLYIEVFMCAFNFFIKALYGARLWVEFIFEGCVGMVQKPFLLKLKVWTTESSTRWLVHVPWMIDG